MALFIRWFLNYTSKTSNILCCQSFHKTIGQLAQVNIGYVHEKLVIRYKLIASLLDLPEKVGRKIVFRNRTLLKLDESWLMASVTILKEMNISLEEVMDYPQILSSRPGKIEQRFYCLKELGIHPIGIPEIIRYPTLMKMTAVDLKRLHLLPIDRDPMEHLLKQIPWLDQSFLTKYPNLRTMSMLYIRKVVLTEVLSKKLECRKSEVLRMIETYIVLNTRGVCFLLAAVELLADQLGFSLSKIKSNGYLLTIHPNNVNMILSELPHMVGDEVNNFCLRYPSVLSVRVSQIMSTNECLKSFGISREQINNCGNIYTLKTEIVRKRLEEVLGTCDFEEVRRYPRILSLVYSLDKAKKRLRYLKALGFDYTLFDMQTTSNLHFKQRVFNEERCPSGLKPILFLAEQFNCDKKWIKEQLQQHPRRNLCETCYSIDVVHFLNKEGFSKQQILNALHIVLYDKETVKKYLALIPVKEDVKLFDNWKTHPFILQFLLYLIERSISSAANLREANPSVKKEENKPEADQNENVS